VQVIVWRWLLDLLFFVVVWPPSVGSRDHFCYCLGVGGGARGTSSGSVFLDLTQNAKMNAARAPRIQQARIFWELTAVVDLILSIHNLTLCTLCTLWTGKVNSTELNHTMKKHFEISEVIVIPHDETPASWSKICEPLPRAVQRGCSSVRPGEIGASESWEKRFCGRGFLVSKLLISGTTCNSVSEVWIHYISLLETQDCLPPSVFSFFCFPWPAPCDAAPSVGLHGEGWNMR